MRPLVDKIGSWLPQGYGDAARQLSLFVVAELCYEAVRGVADGQRATAFINGQNVISGNYFGLDSAGSVGLEAAGLATPLALVLGSEGKGLRHLTRETCDVVARLDLMGAEQKR